MQPDRQTDRQTNRHTQRSTSHQYAAAEVKLFERLFVTATQVSVPICVSLLLMSGYILLGAFLFSHCLMIVQSLFPNCSVGVS